MAEGDTMRHKSRLGLLLAVTMYGATGHTQQGEKPLQREQSSFSMEQEIVPIEKPVTLPGGALQALEKDTDVSSCMENANVSSGQLPSSWFVGSQIHLEGPGEMDLIVLPRNLGATQSMHPAPNACFFGPYTAKFWVLRMTREGYELALSVHTHGLGVLKTRWKGYRDIETAISSLNGSTTTLYRFDGQHYKSYSARSESVR